MSLARTGRSVVVAALIMLVSCTSTDRPDIGIWNDRWETMTSIIPDQGDLGEPPDEALCRSTLAQIREKSDTIFPSPSVTVDDLAEEWVTVAEEAFFDCPPEGQDIHSFDDAYRELDRLERSVMAALGDDA